MYLKNEFDLYLKTEGLFIKESFLAHPLFLSRTSHNTHFIIFGFYHPKLITRSIL